MVPQGQPVPSAVRLEDRGIGQMEIGRGQGTHVGEESVGEGPSILGPGPPDRIRGEAEPAGERARELVLLPVSALDPDHDEASVRFRNRVGGDLAHAEGFGVGLEDPRHAGRAGRVEREPHRPLILGGLEVRAHGPRHEGVGL